MITDPSIMENTNGVWKGIKCCVKLFEKYNELVVDCENEEKISWIMHMRGGNLMVLPYPISN